MSKVVERLLDYIRALEEDRVFLQCLYQVGVDNWEGYEEALNLFEERSS